MTIKTSENVFVVFSFDRVLKEEPKLSGNYFYTISPFAQELVSAKK